MAEHDTDDCQLRRLEPFFSAIQARPIFVVRQCKVLIIVYIAASRSITNLKCIAYMLIGGYAATSLAILYITVDY